MTADDFGPECARCGGECIRTRCGECGGSGETEPGELYESDPLWYDPDETRPCGLCQGAGGWWFCGNSEEWCEAHPLPGRETARPGHRKEPTA